MAMSVMFGFDVKLLLGMIILSKDTKTKLFGLKLTQDLTDLESLVLTIYRYIKLEFLYKSLTSQSVIS